MGYSYSWSISCKAKLNIIHKESMIFYRSSSCYVCVHNQTYLRNKTVLHIFVHLVVVCQISLFTTTLDDQMNITSCQTALSLLTVDTKLMILSLYQLCNVSQNPKNLSQLSCMARFSVVISVNSLKSFNIQYHF